MAYKLSKRFDQDISAVLMAGYLDIQSEKITDIKIAFGGMAAIPKRAVHLEAYLKGQNVPVFGGDEGESEAKFATNIAACLAREFDPIDDMRASRSYRLLAATQLVQKMFIEYRVGYTRLSTPQHFRNPEDFTATIQV